MKICQRCKKEKQISDFYKHSGMTDGYLSFCKNCKIADSFNYYTNNKNKVKEHQVIPEIRERKLKFKKQWNIDNKEYILKYRQGNKTQRNKQRKERYSNDLEYRILGLLRSRLFAALKGICKSAKTIELLGCSVKELKIHIESLFKQGMNWNNQGKWHIDHIKPCVSFDLIEPVQQKKCFNYTNLQPLWAKDNHKKRELF